MKTGAWILAMVCFLGCSPSIPRSEPGENVQDDFYAQAKLIMSKFEIEIFEHLADAQARDEFIADFWNKRDPTPASEANEFKEEFSRRVEFANRWFHEKGPAASGWDSERGRILLMLGFPDQREQMPMLNNPAVHAAEIWIYRDFASGSIIGRLNCSTPSSRSGPWAAIPGKKIISASRSLPTLQVCASISR
jgi:GWxTD domain-containing protein